MNKWKMLKNRYSSNRCYEARKVLKSQHHFYDFVEFLINEGADISIKPAQDEALRFYIGNEKEIGIVYTKGSGNILAHDLGMKYQQSINDPITKDFHTDSSFELNVYG